MPLRKEPPTPRSAAASARLDPTNHAANSTASALGPLIPFKPGQASLRNQTILTEDEYTSALSSIIKRDFFPNLDRLAAENEYLAAVESDDPPRVRLALNKLLQLDGASTPQRERKQRCKNVPGITPKRTGESDEWDDTPVASGSGSRVFDPTFTPALTNGADASEHVAPPQEAEAEPEYGMTPEPGISLAAFQARYTSEDNASFSQLLDRDNQQRKRKHAHLFAREHASQQRRRQIMQAEQVEAQEGRQLAIEANPEHPKLLEQANAPLRIADGEGKGKRPEVEAKEKKEYETRRDDPMDDLMLIPEPRKDDRKAAAGHSRWKYTARNALIYGPDANSNALHAQPSAASTPPASGDAAPEPSTNLSALRFRDEHAGAAEREGSEAGWSPSSSRVNAAIQRGRAGSIASTRTDDTPKVNGYGFVTPYSTPQHPHATARETQHEIHLRIYNAIKARRSGSTPAVEEGAAVQEGRHFELPRLDKRERAAQKLLATASPAAGGSTPYGVAKYTGLKALKPRRFASPRADARQLTSAARALLDRSTRGLTPRSGGVASPMAQPGSGVADGRDRSVGSRAWTPTPQHQRRRP